MTEQINKNMNASACATANAIVTTSSLRLALMLVFLTFLFLGCASKEDGNKPVVGDGTGNTGTGNNDGTVGIVELQSADFAANLYPILVNRCGSCHASNGPGGTPDFAHEDVATAYAALLSNTLVNLGNPGNSRLVQKPLTLHRCTKATCEMWAGEIQAGIVAWASATVGSQIGAGVTGSSILSASLTLADGVKNSGAGRVEDAIIAKYTFKTGNGTTAFDTSGVTPAIDLTLSAGVTWVSGQGIEITDLNAAGTTKAVATPATSKKLYDKIAGPAGSKEYTIEAWIINDNTALTGPARIVSYSLNSQNRNFTMGQVTDYYNFRNRSDLTGNSGSNPALESAHNDDDLKAELQHVVMTFD
ncbi:MAG: hypothetical protein ACC707_17795, partial [Thiohalomonadales bacterium]